VGVAVAVLGALLALGLVSGLVVARAAPATEVTLRLWPAGQGRIEVVQGGKDLTPDPCGFGAILANATECVVTVTTGTPVTLRAVAEPGATVPVGRESNVPDFPVPQPAFVRWSRGDCGTAATCTFTPDADSDRDWITALFTPLQLQVGVFGVGDVKFRRPDGVVVTPQCAQGVGFGDRTCHAAFPADAEIVVEVSPAPTGWARCEPEGGNATSARCTVAMSNVRTFAFVSFNGQGALDPPFQLTPKVRVRRTGSGQGSVSGSGIVCPPTCEVQVDYQSRVRLRAQENGGSTFVRWVGVCSTDRTCVFAAGSATEVHARFDANAPPPTTTTRTTTTTTTTTTPRLRARLANVSVRGHGPGRVAAFTVVVNRRARATARLVRQRKAIAARTYALVSGRNVRRLRVPRATRPGVYRLSVRVVAGGRSQTLAARMRIRG